MNTPANVPDGRTTTLPDAPPVDVEEIMRDLEAFLRRSFQIPEEDRGFTRQVNLWEQGYVDSAGVVETIAHLERRWKIALPEQVVFHPEFTNVAGIAELIGNLLRGKTV